eukprot:Filipodium_phascolosomae@DN2868_c0_g1_i1.p1
MFFGSHWIRRMDARAASASCCVHGRLCGPLNVAILGPPVNCTTKVLEMNRHRMVAHSRPMDSGLQDQAKRRKLLIDLKHSKNTSAFGAKESRSFAKEKSVKKRSRPSKRYPYVKHRLANDLSAQERMRLISLEDPKKFWKQKASKVHWFKRYTTCLDDSRAPIYKWFAGGEVNACYEALDQQVKDGRGNQVAIYYDSPLLQMKEAVSWNLLLTKVAKFAGALQEAGVCHGDRVLIYMP